MTLPLYHPSVDRQSSVVSKLGNLFRSRRTRAYLATRTALLITVCLFIFWWLPEGYTPFSFNGVSQSYDIRTKAPQLSDGVGASDIWLARAEEVKSSFLDAYHAYEKAAFGYDEISPVSNGRVQK